MSSKDDLRAMIDDIINDNTEQAKVNFNKVAQKHMYKALTGDDLDALEISDEELEDNDDADIDAEVAAAIAAVEAESGEEVEVEGDIEPETNEDDEIPEIEEIEDED
jgi:hypothetical protein